MPICIFAIWKDFSKLYLCQSFADWQAALSVHLPAEKKESKVVIKSVYKVDGIR